MTGFGRHKQLINDTEITVEIKSVNHRYLDLSIKTPRIYGFLDDFIKKEVSKSILRGKVDVFVTIDMSKNNDTSIEINENILMEYIKLCDTTCSKFGIENDLKMSNVLKIPDILSLKKEDANAEKLTHDVILVLSTALENHSAMRLAEGIEMKSDILSRTENIKKMVALVEEKSPMTVVAYREKLFKKLKEVLEDTTISEDRILAESAVFADKVSVCEETVRLYSHIIQLCKMAECDGAIGRKLDFLIQEFNREANTIGSKATDSDIAKVVIDMKSEIEKIREQIQNVE